MPHKEVHSYPLTFDNLLYLLQHADEVSLFVDLVRQDFQSRKNFLAVETCTRMIYRIPKDQKHYKGCYSDEYAPRNKVELSTISTYGPTCDSYIQ